MSSFQPESEVLGCLLRADLMTNTFYRLDGLKRDKILDAILRELCEREPSSISIKKVAARAGVPVGSFYQYFKDRDAMVSCACRIAAARFLNELESYRDDILALPLREGLHTYISGFMEWGRISPVLLKVFAIAAYREFSASGSEARTAEIPISWSEELVEPLAKGMLSVVEGMVSTSLEKGEITAGMGVHGAARFVNALTITACDSLLLPGLNRYYRYFDDTSDHDAVFSGLIDFIMAGLGEAKRRGIK